MYTEEDLNQAIDARIFTASSVAQFRQFIAARQHSQPVDEENFRLLSGFNDIFVLIASALLLISTVLLTSTFSIPGAALTSAVFSWGLAEFFVRKRRMALPAIGLLIAFVFSAAAIPVVIVESPTEFNFIVSALVAVMAAFAHWQRFKVPITVAAGTLVAGAALVAALVKLMPFLITYQLEIMFCLGLAVFAFAMYWDTQDKLRQTRASDVAFWLHLIAAPLLVHPVFASLGLLHGVADLSSSLLAILMYAFLAVISIAVDRRAVMVSALVYLVYALSGVLETYGIVSYSFAITGVVVGGTLLILSAYWQGTRAKILSVLPAGVSAALPVAR